MSRPSLCAPMVLAAAVFGSGCSTPVHLVSSSPSGPVPSAASLAGNWQVIGTYATPPTSIIAIPLLSFVGDLSISDGVITGLFRAEESAKGTACSSFLTGLPAAATLDATNTLTITIPFFGGIATLTAPLTHDSYTVVSGTYQVVGGTCAMAKSPMLLAHFAPVTGIYTGSYNILDKTLAPVPGTASIITATLTQSATADANGSFPLSGTVTATGACTGTLLIQSGTVLGSGIISAGLDATSAPAGDFIGSINPLATTITGLFSLFKTCDGPYHGVLTRQ